VHLAAQIGSSECLKCLVGRDNPRLASIISQKEDINGDTALHFAVSSGSLDCVRLLVTAGAEINCMNSNHMTPLLIAAMGGFDKLLIRICAENPDFSLCGPDRRTAAFFAAESENMEFLQILKGNHFDFNVPDAVGDTLLHCAVRMDALQSMSFLMTNGSNPFALNKKKETPMQLIKSKAAENILRGIDKNYLEKIIEQEGRMKAERAQANDDRLKERARRENRRLADAEALKRSKRKKMKKKGGGDAASDAEGSQSVATALEVDDDEIETVQTDADREEHDTQTRPSTENTESTAIQHKDFRRLPSRSSDDGNSGISGDRSSKESESNTRPTTATSDTSESSR
jgi:hypothetical protein